MKKKNRYGYKVGYCKNGSRLFIRKFITRTHQQAHQMLVFYRKFGHQRVAQNFNYEIQPITKKEVLAGIWDELPFLYKCPRHYLYRWAHSDEEIQSVEDWVNNYPRQVLEFATPNELFNACLSSI